MTLAMTADQCQARAAEYDEMAVTVAYAPDKARFAEQAATWRRLAAEASRIEEEHRSWAPKRQPAAGLFASLFGRSTRH